MPHHDGAMSGQCRPQRTQRGAGETLKRREIKPGDMREDRLGVAEIGFRHAQERSDARVHRRDEGAVNEARSGFRVGCRDHDKELVGVGHEHLFGRVHVIGAATQDASPLRHPHETRERSRFPAAIAHQRHLVTRHDRYAKVTGTGGQKDPLCRGSRRNEHLKPAPGHAEDPSGEGIAVSGADLCPGTRAERVRPNAHIRLVEVVLAFVVGRGPGPEPGHTGSSARSRRQSDGNSGKVLLVQPMSSTTTPGTARPRIAPEVAIRWSA